ncbi:MAG: hypothetical protein RIR51_1830, partial [Bacteroidota bacterium]
LIIHYADGNSEKVEGKTIGNKRIQEFKKGMVKNIEIIINDSRDVPLISNLEVYNF